MMPIRIRPLLITSLAALAIASAWMIMKQRVSGIAPLNRADATRPQSPSKATVSRRNEALPDRIERCIATGDTLGMQSLFSKWFDRDPVAVRDWLQSQKSLKPFQPALVQIARDISAAGSPADALKWAELLEPGPDRDQALLEIYATGRRYRSLSEEEVRRAPFPPRQIESLLSGAADD